MTRVSQKNGEMLHVHCLVHLPQNNNKSLVSPDALLSLAYQNIQTNRPINIFLKRENEKKDKKTNLTCIDHLLFLFPIFPCEL